MVASLAQSAISTLFVPDTDSIVSFNIPPNSDDINFYATTPDWYQYTAIGFGTSMSDALILVLYPSEDGKGVTVSPRRSTGNTEPVHAPETKVTVHMSAVNDNSDMIVNATCHGCQAFTKVGSAAPMMFAVGPDLDLKSDDLAAEIRRHVAYAKFNINLLKATGPGGISSAISGSASASGSDTILNSGELHQDSNTAATAHGIVYGIATLAVAPFDSLVAGAMGSRWAWMHGITATVYFAFVIGAFVPGVMISREHVATQQYRTPHQVLGLIAFAVLTIMFLWGIALSWIKRSAKQRGQEPPESTRLLAIIHRWTCRLIWVLTLVNIGLGLKLSEQKTVFLLAYIAVALGLLVIIVPVYFCMWRFTKKKKEKEEAGHEMYTIYDHNYR
ncbi:uncharacterized protein C8A04DRAFT_25513 [Dichotomopilus funicola]|uniref:Cellobiose dehydrogenase-like cytochrome domain-containing protein n=1 Tax=Dichotomopilus funicola TaxID=1934379 RepID=A0AAN6V859_9PEZI|nr:hypothetical protein C8A04DRAFT_25513 [Dichotomopilus funicola]